MLLRVQRRHVRAHTKGEAAELFLFCARFLQETGSTLEELRVRPPLLLVTIASLHMCPCANGSCVTVVESAALRCPAPRTACCACARRCRSAAARSCASPRRRRRRRPRRCCPTCALSPSSHARCIPLHRLTPAAGAPPLPRQPPFPRVTWPFSVTVRVPSAPCHAMRPPENCVCSRFAELRRRRTGGRACRLPSPHVLAA